MGTARKGVEEGEVELGGRAGARSQKVEEMIYSPAILLWRSNHMLT